MNINTYCGQSWPIMIMLVIIMTFATTQANSTCPSGESAPDSSETRLAYATTGFAINFIKSLKTRAEENVAICPLSLMNVLNMVLLGSEENTSTQQELFDVLGYSNSSLSDNRLKPHEAARDICILDQAGPPSNLLNFTLANLILTNKDLIELNADYEKELSMYYKVKVENFTRDAAAAKQAKPLHDRVNDWVKNQTNNEIEKLAEESDLSGDSLVMVLLNAAYFKARWLHTFNARSTRINTFYNQGKETVDVKFMSQKGVFGYVDFNTNASPMDVFLSSDSKTRTSEDEETLLTEDVAATPAPAVSNSTAASSNTTTTTTKPDAGSATIELPKPSTSTTAASESSSESSNASPPTIELSKDGARRLELTSKLNCSALMLPFSLNEGQDLSMVILLPAKRDGLGELLANLNAQTLNEVYRSLTEQTVQIELPKFNFESSHDAKETLKSMGLNAIFTDSARLGRMYHLAGTVANSSSSAATSGTGPVQVDKVIHKAKIGVDESGAEAAAASMVSLGLRHFLRPATPTFVADHPFLFIIRHNKSNMPLFMGQVNRL